MRPFALLCLLLTACASPHWVNVRDWRADLDADRAACNLDSERVGRLNQLTNPTPPEACGASQASRSGACAGGVNAESLRVTATAQLAFKQCMGAKGWQAR